MRILSLLTLAFVIAVLCVLGCPRQPDTSSPQVPAPPGPKLADLPVEMTARQRTTTPVPDSEGALNLTIDDVTRGQVIVSLSHESGSVVLAPTSLAEGASAAFSFDGQSYSITLGELDNELIGDDSATLVIAEAPPADAADGLSEREKIEFLIDRVAALQGAVFIRNGEEHTPAEAAEHLRTKWKAAGDEIATVEDFIEKIASRSSTTGQPYLIRTDRGESEAAQWLRSRLTMPTSPDP